MQKKRNLKRYSLLFIIYFHSIIPSNNNILQGLKICKIQRHRRLIEKYIQNWELIKIDSKDPKKKLEIKNILNEILNKIENTYHGDEIDWRKYKKTNKKESLITTGSLAQLRGLIKTLAIEID